jgi:hypothetical protein
MKKIWRYINYDMIDTCLLSLWIIVLIRGILDNYFDEHVYVLGGLAFAILYTAGVMFRMGSAKDIMNEWLTDEGIRRSLGMNIYDLRHRSPKIRILPWIFFTLWTLILFFVLIIKR